MRPGSVTLTLALPAPPPAPAHPLPKLGKGFDDGLHDHLHVHRYTKSHQRHDRGSQYTIIDHTKTLT